jgi:hypothetical protein
MAKAELTVIHNQLVYTGTFVRPPLQIWGQGNALLQGVYDALSPFGVRLSDIRSESVSPDVAGQAITANLKPNGMYRFRFDKVETTFFNFSEPVLSEIPRFCESSTEWIRKYAHSVEFGSHKFVYSCHGQLKETPILKWLRLANGDIPIAGQSQGAGAIFYWSVPEKAWTTQLVIDRSVLLSDGLFLMFSLEVKKDEVVFEDIGREGRAYLETILAKLDLEFTSGTG